MAQWRYIASTSSYGTSISFPIAFISSMYCTATIDAKYDGEQRLDESAINVSLTQYTLRGTDLPCYIFILGY